MKNTDIKIAIAEQVQAEPWNFMFEEAFPKLIVGDDTDLEWLRKLEAIEPEPEPEPE